MLEAVRIFARQQLPNYRKPAGFLVKETYPLPPYSSVIGFVHAICGWREYHPMRVSVQGSFASTVSDYMTNYVFGGLSFDPTRHQLWVDNGDGKREGITRTPKSYELLTDVTLLLHVIPEDGELVNPILSALNDPPVYPSLGRYEDLLQIEGLDAVLLTEPPRTFTARYDAYLPLSLTDPLFSQNLSGTLYRLGKVFEYDTGKGRQPTPGKKNRRVWKELVTARHICAGVELRGTGGILYDEKNGDAVYPA